MNQSRFSPGTDIFSHLEITRIKEVIESCRTVDDEFGTDDILVVRLDPTPVTVSHLILFGAIVACLVVAGSNFNYHRLTLIIPVIFSHRLHAPPLSVHSPDGAERLRDPSSRLPRLLSTGRRHHRERWRRPQQQ